MIGCRKKTINDNANSCSERNHYKSDETPNLDGVINNSKFEQDIECEDTYLIRDNKMGCYSLNDSIAWFKNKNKNCKEMTYLDEGVKNIRVKCSLDNAEYIEAEANSHNGLVQVYRTNSTRYTTESGLKVGDDIASIKRKGKNIEVISDVGELILGFTDEKITFRISKESEEEYFNEGGSFPENLKESYRIYLFEIR